MGRRQAYIVARVGVHGDVAVALSTEDVGQLRLRGLGVWRRRAAKDGLGPVGLLLPLLHMRARRVLAFVFQTALLNHATQLMLHICSCETESY